VAFTASCGVTYTVIAIFTLSIDLDRPSVRIAGIVTKQIVIFL
jgi:hypothetical protein